MGELKIVALYNEHETSELGQHPIIGAMGVHLGDDDVVNITSQCMEQLPMVFTYRTDEQIDFIDAKFANAHYSYQVMQYVAEFDVYECRVISKRLI